jgi:transposase
MRGDDRQQSHLFSYISPEKRVPADHPLRPIRRLTDEVLRELSPRFDQMYSVIGRPSIPPEHLLRALLLQVFYTVRSERQLMEQLDYNLLFRWFVGLNVDDEVWSPTTYSKNRDRLLEGEVAELFFEKVLGLAERHALVSTEHFTVDGTLIEAWASMKSFVRKEQIAAEQQAAESTDDPNAGPPPSNPDVDFKGEKRSNQTHASRTDPDARLYRKGEGQASKLCYMGHVLMENRHGLVVDTRLTHATGTAEREAAAAMVDDIDGAHRVTVGGDKGYDTKQFVADLRDCNATPHVAQNTSGRSSAIDARTTRHEGYGISQRKRKRVEEIFGWMKTVGVLRKTRHRGVERVGWMFRFAAAAFNLIRIRNLVAEM